MSGINNTRFIVVLGFIAGLSPVFHPSVLGQGVAFEPQVSPFLDGAMVGVTPVVSADRRYVRMSLVTSFNQLNGFTTYSVPAAVSGSGGGAGGLAGVNGLLGAGGGGGATGRGGSLIQGGNPLAGPFGIDGNVGPPIVREPKNPDAVDWPKISSSGEEVVQETRPARAVAASTPATNPRRRIQASNKALQIQRAAALKAARQQTAAAVRRGR